MAEKRIVIVDGANVAYCERTQHGKPKLSNLTVLRRELQERGYEPIIIVDASLRHEVDDPDQLEALVDNQTIRQAPANTAADYFILKSAQEHGCRIISNDRYLQYREQFPWVDQRRVPLMIINGLIELYEEERLEEEAC